MPPGSGYQVISEHIVTLIQEISSLKQDIIQLKDAVGKSNNGDVTDLKDFHDIKVLLKKVNNGPTFSTVTDSMSLVAQPNISLSANKNSISSAKLWPEDIIVRKFFKPRNHGPRSN